jgi:pimeloyl-ACP methyl ester carboxylesterase
MGMFLYVAVSFAVMRSHVAPRPILATLREVAREALWVALTQPLIPLYYVFGRRMSSEGRGVPVVFVHGYFQNRANFIGIARALRRAKLGPAFGFNYRWASPVEESAARLGRFVERVCEATGAERVVLVAHSLGGLVALEYCQTEDGTRRVDKCVTIASPHAGVAWRGPILGAVGAQMRRDSTFMLTRRTRALTAPTLSIFSTHDNMVHPKETSSLRERGGEDCEIEGPGHLAILFHDDVTSAIVRFVESA